MIFAIAMTIFLAVWWIIAPKRPPLWLAFVAVGWFAFAWTYVMHKV